MSDTVKLLLLAFDHYFMEEWNKADEKGYSHEYINGLITMYNSFRTFCVRFLSDEYMEEAFGEDVEYMKADETHSPYLAECLKPVWKDGKRINE